MHGVEVSGKGAPPPDGGWGWVVVFASFMIHVIADGVAYTFGIFIVEIVDDFKSSMSVTSGIASIMAGMTYLSGPIAGAFVNKWGCRPVSTVGSIMASIGFGLSYFAQHVTHLYLTIGLLGGFGLGLIYLPAIVSVSCYFEQKRAFATGIAVCGSGVGTFILAPLMSFLILHYGWRLSLVITSVILLQCVFFSLLFKPLPELPMTPPTVDSPAVSIFRARNSLQNEYASRRDQLIPPVLLSSEVEFEPRDSFEPLLSPNQQPKKYLGSGGKKQEALSISASHPVLPVTFTDSTHQPVRRHSLRGGIPFYSSAQLITNRRDIFYSGSLANINQAGTPIVEEIPPPPDAKCRRFFKCCPPEFIAALQRMMDFSLLKVPVFLFFAISNFLTSIGYNVPFIYIADMAIGGGNEKNPSGFLLSIIGISNTLSRVVLGYASDKPCVNRLYLYNTALAVAGIATGLVSHTSNLIWLRVYAAVFGVTMGVFVSLTSVILVDLLGLEKLTSAFGLLLSFQGVATLVGPPIVGKLFDELGDYRWGFWLAGGMMSLSGLMLFFIPCLGGKKPKKSQEDARRNHKVPIVSESKAIVA